MRNWTLYLDNPYDCIYKSIGSDGNDEISLSFDKRIKTMSFHSMYFEFKEECTWEQQQAEKDEWLKHSCKYGNWRSDCILTLEKEDLEFALKEYTRIFGNMKK